MFGPGENPSAALLKNGKLIALIEEERINRIKTSPNDLNKTCKSWYSADPWIILTGSARPC